MNGHTAKIINRYARDRKLARRIKKNWNKLLPSERANVRRQMQEGLSRPKATQPPSSEASPAPLSASPTIL